MVDPGARTGARWQHGAHGWVPAKGRRPRASIIIGPTPIWTVVLGPQESGDLFVNIDGEVHVYGPRGTTRANLPRMDEESTVDVAALVGGPGKRVVATLATIVPVTAMAVVEEAPDHPTAHQAITPLEKYAQKVWVRDNLTLAVIPWAAKTLHVTARAPASFCHRALEFGTSPQSSGLIAQFGR